MSDLDKKLEELRSYFAEFLGRPLTDEEFNNIPAVKKLKKNTSNDAQNIDKQNNNIVVNSSTTNSNLQVDSANNTKNFDYQKDKQNLFSGDMEIELLGMLLLKKGAAIPTVASILTADDFFHKEHQIIYKNILALYGRGIVPNILSLIEEMRGNGDLEKAGLNITLSIGDNAYTNAYAVPYAEAIKKYSLRRQLHQFAVDLSQKTGDITFDFDSLISDAQSNLHSFSFDAEPSKLIDQHNYFNNVFGEEVTTYRQYADRLTGFDNIDQHQIFSPGLYVIGATPACGKTTFAWQLLYQLASLNESCIFCSYEMSKFELYSKTLARELFRRDSSTTITAANIRYGSHSAVFDEVFKKVTHPNFPKVNLFELRDESIDDLIRLLRPLCSDKVKPPVVCIDYLQIIPPADDRRLLTDKMKIDDIVRKLKTFQRETNTTFIVISSFNRLNYYQQVSFESFKDSGNIEYSADVVWALQLNVVNSIKIGAGISDTRKKFDDAKRQQPRLIQLKCLKNRQGNNYDCFFHYFSAHDFFEPFDKDVTSEDDNQSDTTQNDSNQAIE